MYDNLTKDDIKKMQEEIEYRKLVVRKEALEAVKEARAQGDLSENFEYKAAKQDKNRNESRIRYLEKMIKTARSRPLFAQENGTPRKQAISQKDIFISFDCVKHLVFPAL